MKRIAAILLVITLLTSLFYNAINYYMMLSYQKEQSWIASKKNTPQNQYKVIKLNATLYSFIEDTDLELVNENIVLDNKVYHIFKKQIKDNVLNLYYLGDESLNSIDITLKKIVDTQSDSNSSKIPFEKLFKSISKDYLVHVYKNFDCKLVNVRNSIKNFKNENPKLLTGFSFENYSPPEFV